MRKMPEEYDLDLVSYPSPYGGKIVKLANEMVFAQFDLELVEQKLLYYAMSVFDFEGFLTDTDVFGALTNNGRSEQDLGLVTPQMLNKYYWSPELRAVRIPLYDLMRYISKTGDDGRGNWKWFDRAVDTLGEKRIYIRGRDSEKQHHRIPILGETYYINKDGKKEVVVTFAQEFMPYLIAFQSYKKINLRWLARLESKYSSRFLHYFIYALDNKRSGTFSISVQSLRQRLGIEPEKLKRNFYERVVKKSIDDIIEKIPDLNVGVTIDRDSTKRGRPTTGYTFKVSLKNNEIIEEKKSTKDLMPSAKEPLPKDNYDLLF